MNNMTNSVPSTHIQFLAVCHYINTFGIFFNNKDHIANHEKNQTESTLNALLQYLSESNKSEAKCHLLQKILKEIDLYLRGRIPKIDRYANDTYMYIIHKALFPLYKNTTKFFNRTYNNFAVIKQHVFQNLSKGSINDFCSFQNFSKLTTQIIAKVYEFIVRFFIHGEKIERNLNEKRKEIQILKRFKRYPIRTGGISNVSKTDFRLQEGSSLPETTETDDDNGALTKLNQALYSLANSQYSDDINLVDDIESLINDQNSDNVGGNIKDDAFDFDNDVEKRMRDFSGDHEDKYNLKNVPPGSQKIFIAPEELGINVTLKKNKQASDDSNTAAKMRKILSRNDKSVRTMGNKDPNIGFSGTSKGTTSTSSEVSEPPRIGQMDYNFSHTLRKLRDMGLSVLKQDKNILKQFRIDLNNLTIGQANYQKLDEPMELWFSETKNRPNIINFLSNLEGKIFFFNDITLLRKINGGKPWETLTQDSNDLPDEEFKIYYHITINLHSGFVHFTDDITFEDLYITFPDVRFIVQQTKFLNNTKTLIMKLTNLELSTKDYFSQRLDEFYVLTLQEKVKTKRLKAIEKAAEIISSNVPMHTFEAALGILKRYVLKLEENETPVPTYDELAEDYCSNLEAPSEYESWKIPDHELIKTVIFDANFDDEVVGKECQKLFAKSKPGFKIKYGNFWDLYKSSTSMQSSARAVDFLYLYKFMDSHYQLGNIKKERLSISFCIFALRQCEEDFIDTPVTLNYIKYVNRSNMLNYYSTKNLNVELEVFYLKQQQIDINNLSYGTGRYKYPQFIKLELKNKVGLVNLDRFTGGNTGNFIIAPGMTFEVNSFRYNNSEGVLVQVLRMYNNHTKEKNMINIIRKFSELLN